MTSRRIKFLSYYKPYLGLLFADLACAFIVSATILLIPLCVRYITKNILETVPADAIPQILTVGALMLGLVALHALCNTFVDYRGHLMGAMMERDIRRELFEHYQKLSFRFYDEQKTGQLMTRLTNDSFDLSELYHHGPEDIVISALNFIGAFIILLLINPLLALIVFLFLPVMALYAFHFNRKMRRAMRASADRIGDINAQIQDTLDGIRVVKTFTNADLEQKKFASENERFLDSRRVEYKSEAYFYEGMLVFTQLMTIAVVVFGAIAIVSNTLDLPDLLTFLLYIGILIEPINRFSNFTRLYQSGMTGFDRILDILQIEPDTAESSDGITLDHVRGDITFQNVSFKYQDHHEHVLKNVSLHIRAGEYVALVGASGVGKTTLCSLIPRFYQVTSGEILLDGVNLNDIQLHSLRRNIGIVQQDVYLFNGTVADNIRYGKLDADRESIIAAARQANAHNFIMQLPNGYDTDIGQRGVKLSGGQKQRLSIARAFLKDPPILIFDEATSALDNESEQAIRTSLDSLAAHRTMLVIAHRLSTIRRATRILVLTEDGIVEQGTHQSLMAQNGAYASLYNMQLTI